MANKHAILQAEGSNAALVVSLPSDQLPDSRTDVTEEFALEFAHTFEEAYGGPIQPIEILFEEEVIIRKDEGPVTLDFSYNGTVLITVTTKQQNNPVTLTIGDLVLTSPFEDTEVQLTGNEDLIITNTVNKKTDTTVIIKNT